MHFQLGRNSHFLPLKLLSVDYSQEICNPLLRESVLGIQCKCGFSTYSHSSINNGQFENIILNICIKALECLHCQPETIQLAAFIYFHERIFWGYFLIRVLNQDILLLWISGNKFFVVFLNNNKLYLESCCLHTRLAFLCLCWPKVVCLLWPHYFLL